MSVTVDARLRRPWSARVWCARVRPKSDAASVETRVVVDFGAQAPPPAVVGALLARVNTCVARDHLHVYEQVLSRSDGRPNDDLASSEAPHVTDRIEA